MQIPDGSRLDYSTDKTKWNRYSWGWLGDKVPEKSRGWTDQTLKRKVVNRLQEMAKGHTVLCHCGYHLCEICQKKGRKLKEMIGMNGSFLIKHRSREYRCPAQVEHYILEHDYNPGPKPIAALFEGKWKTRADEDKENDREMDRWHKKRAKARRAEERAMTPEQKAARAAAVRLEKFAQEKLKQLRRDGALVSSSYTTKVRNNHTMTSTDG